ncbi:uncharacterized protein LOC142319860 [Lycorma delicatula]|uniref:uncharacterized protein LOC142319860 n=1 Tax=Lycorma delicatula TaxID=130591 RepID=UPI003F517F75
MIIKDIESLRFPNKTGRMDAIFFLGNTGAGKSTLVQILSANNSKIFSKSSFEGSDDFIIVDYSKIGMDITTSQTLYPDFVVDTETGYVLCDNPGFKDTRSPIHEIIAMYSLKKVLKNTNKIKIVIVVPHSSLKVSMYRNDFLVVLQHTIQFIRNIDKYGKSIYLIATKADNLYARGILRKPDEEGPLVNLPLIQNEKSRIRNMLLDGINMVPVNESDFGLTLSESALILLEHQYNISCSNNSLFLINFHVVISEIKDIISEECVNASNIKIYAINTIYIDYNLNSDYLKGKSLIIIAPVWYIVGKRHISLDGSDGGPPMVKAKFSKTGSNGKNGMPGGTFFGGGETFINSENLIISACGGDGQDGQDGGDGFNGKDGENGRKENCVTVNHKGEDDIVYVRNHTWCIAKAELGEVGGDSGIGGNGGFGGMKGSVKLYNYGHQDHNISIVVEDGKNGIDGIDGIPGKGGKSGCDLHVQTLEKSVLGIRFHHENITDFINCSRKSEDGIILRNENLMTETMSNEYITPDISWCEQIINYRNSYLNKYHSFLSDGITRNFINQMM